MLRRRILCAIWGARPKADLASVPEGLPSRSKALKARASFLPRDFYHGRNHPYPVYSSYEAAVDAWRAQAQRTVDDAEMKYVVVHIHKLLTPED